MAIVLPEHLMKGKSTKFVRNWLYGVAEIKAIISFPEEAFTPYGAMVKTCLCIFRKLKTDEKENNEQKTFLCQIDNLGYDATGRKKSGSEIESVISEFHNQVGWQ